MFQNVGFIGTGTMGSAVAEAVDKSGRATSILLCNRTPEKANLLAGNLSNAAVGTNVQAVQQCDLVFLGVKPQMMEQVFAEIQPILQQRTTPVVLASMAAGISCRRIQQLAGIDCPIIRMMPNTPVSIGEGVVQYCGLDVQEEILCEFEALIAPAGLVDRIEEHQMDAASCVSGCGPAFAYLFIEALADGGVACGLPREKAMKYAARMLRGSAEMVLEKGKHPGKLKDDVCSPGGTTIQGVRMLEERGFRGAAMDAVIKAYEKTKTLG